MMPTLLFEAAVRSVLLALAVWIGLRVIGVRNVPAQKAAWGLVLAGAFAMPIVLPMAAHWTVLPANVRVVLPADPQTLLEELQARIQAPTKAEASPQQKPAAIPATSADGPSQVEAKEMTIVRPRENRAAATKPESHYVESVRYTESAPLAQNATPARLAVAPPHKALSISKIILGVYLAVAAVLLLRLLCGLVVALRVWRKADLVACTSIGNADAAVEVRSSVKISSPVTICSAIVLPADYLNWDSKKLRIVLAHEGSHVRQGDFYLQLLSATYAAAFWPSPLGWWLKRKLSDLAEAISDRAGLEEAADATSYAQILLEFAAAPRPTLIGVAMARSGSISRRIERLLNDVSFRQAFAGSRRALAAVLVVPVALFAATALVRVQAAGQQAPEPPAPVIDPTHAVTIPAPAAAPAAPTSVVLAAEPATAFDTPDEVPTPPALAGTQEGVAPVAPATPAVPALVPAAPLAGTAHVTILPGMPSKGALTLIAPMAPGTPGSASMVIIPRGSYKMAIIAGRGGYGTGYGEARGYGAGQSTTERGSSSYSSDGKHSGYHYSYSSNGQSYAVIRGSGKEHMTFSGNWIEGRSEEIEKARKQAHGDFLWFTRDGKAYFVDDPSTLAQIEALYKPMEALGSQQEALGKEQEALGKQQEELGRQQEKASVPTPDMSKEIAEIDEAMAKLKANQGKAMNDEEFAELQSKLGDLQGRLGEIQGKIGSRQGEFGEQMGKLGEMQGALGEKQGRLGEEQGRIAQEADRKVKSIIDESMKNGKAHPVQ